MFPAGKKSLPAVQLPFIYEAAVAQAEVDISGALAEYASSILMKLLWAARMCRWDLLRCIGVLASQVTRWSSASDIMMYKMFYYLNATLDMTLYLTIHSDMSHWFIDSYSSLLYFHETEHFRHACRHGIRSMSRYVRTFEWSGYEADGS